MVSVPSLVPASAWDVPVGRMDRKLWHPSNSDLVIVIECGE